MKDKLRKDSMYFDTQNGETKKIFTIKFPHELIYSLKWDLGQVEKLKKYEESENISDKLLMLSMIAEKVESNE